LTILPIRFRTLPDVAVIARSRFWYPVVGLILGALLGGWSALLMDWLRSPMLCAFLILLVWVIVSGAVHLDGFCDLCDGLFGGKAPADRLRILRDPHLGTFGVAGGVLLLLGKWIVLRELIERAGAEAPWLLGAAVASARCLTLCMAGLAPYARPEGTGKALIEATQAWEAGLFAVLAAAIAWSIPDVDLRTALILFAPALLAVLGLTWSCRRRLEGVTGDCLGAAIELAEWSFLLAAVIAFLSG
jgi:cobalamin 5'-phosphate synthase/cobalamin synthase